jgi:hypothetical protein
MTTVPLSPKFREAARLEIREFRRQIADQVKQLDDLASRLGPEDLDEPPVTAFWNRRGCPSWCTWTSTHRDDTYPEDRCHRDAGIKVQLTQMAPLEHNKGVYGPDWLEVALRQREDEAEAKVQLIHNELAGECLLTLTEAIDLAGALQMVVAVVRGA